MHSCAGSGELGVCTVGAAVAAAADVEAPPLFPAPFPALGALVGTVVGPAVGAALAMTAGLAADDPTELIRATNPDAETDESLANTIIVLVCVDVHTDGTTVPLYEATKLRVAASVPS